LSPRRSSLFSSTNPIYGCTALSLVLIDRGFRGVDLVKPVALSVPKVWPRIATREEIYAI
jgi:hypothetical protein